MAPRPASYADGAYAGNLQDLNTESPAACRAYPRVAVAKLARLHPTCPKPEPHGKAPISPSNFRPQNESSQLLTSGGAA